MKREVETLLKRSKIFLENAKFNFEKGFYDVAMFNIVQAAQLLIKAKLLELKGSFKQTHNLRELLAELSEIFEKEKILEFIKNNRKTLRNLERAYITSRYLFEEFFEDEVKDAFKVFEELKNIIWKEKNIF